MIRTDSRAVCQFLDGCKLPLSNPVADLGVTCFAPRPEPFENSRRAARLRSAARARTFCWSENGRVESQRGGESRQGRPVAVSDLFRTRFGPARCCDHRSLLGQRLRRSHGRLGRQRERPTKLIFAGILLEVCAVFPAVTAVGMASTPTGLSTPLQ